MNYTEWLKRKDLEYRNGILHFGEKNVLDLASEYDTPFYVINENVIRNRYKTLKMVLDSVYERNKLYFAVKSNSNLSVLKILQSEGAHFDCTSVGEIYACFKAEIPPEKLIYTGNMFTNEDFEFAVKNNVIVNLDSVSQLNRLNAVHEKLNKRKKLASFRFNPEFGAGHHEKTITAGKNIKFGVLENQIVEAYQKAKEYGFEKFGIHQHIGSGIIDSNDYIKATEKFLSVIEKLTELLGINFEFVDFGGGLGIPYRPTEEHLDLEQYKEIVIERFKEFSQEVGIQPPEIYIEPGRYISAESSIILTKINTIKDNGYKRFAGIDAGFNTLIRPAMYGSYHHIVRCKKGQGEKKIYDITGPICESGDVMGRDRELQELKEGDLLAILDAGAYGYTMSSSYNSRPRPAEVLLKDNQTSLIRVAESLEDLLKRQRIPDRLK